MKMCPTTVVNIKHCPDFNPDKNPDDVYIGRFHQSVKYGTLPESIWHNPYWITDEVTRETTIELYKEHISRLLVSKLNYLALCELKGKRLGCWCKPELCHGDVLAELCKEQDR